MLLEDRSFIYAIWMVRRLVSSWMIRKTHFKTVEQRSIVGNDLFRLLITNRWSLIEGPRTRTVLFNVPKRTETENLKMQREWSSLCVAVDWGSGRETSTVAATTCCCLSAVCFCSQLLTCCCSWEKRDSAAAAFCLRLRFFWFDAWVSRDAHVQNLRKHRQCGQSAGK